MKINDQKTRQFALNTRFAMIKNNTKNQLPYIKVNYSEVIYDCNQ